jgi:4-hydroxy 2-oxovalerate aldolase
VEILDCTLRDGGYYTNWDFSNSLVERYIHCTNNLPIDYIEVGYRNPKLPGYHGKYFFCNLEVLRDIRNKSCKKISIMLNQKSISKDDVSSILKPVENYIDLVRIAVSPDKIEETILIAKEIKKFNVKLALNIMYASEWKEDKEFISGLSSLDELCEYIYFVDSYGSMFPADVKKVFEVFESITSKSTAGFHGHNNMEMSLSNTLVAIDNGAGIVDSTMTGMGRGAGNLSTELLLTVLNKKKNLEVDFDSLSEIVSDFNVLKKEHAWGTSLPYMFSGANSFPQKKVMDWITKGLHSFGTIIKTLKNGFIYEKKYEDFKPETYHQVLLVGGGKSVKDHASSILNFLKNNPKAVIIHASARNAKIFSKVDNKQLFCIAGNEGKRIESILDEIDIKNSSFILAPLPSEIEIYVPEKAFDKTYFLKQRSISKIYGKSHTGIAVQIALEVKAEDVFVVGYDGYEEKNLSIKELESFEENTEIFYNFGENKNISLISLTQTKYEPLVQDAVFNYLP